MTYLPQIYDTKSKLFIKIDKQDFPAYYSLFSPVSFDVKKPKFLVLKKTGIESTDKQPDDIYVYTSPHSLSLRVPEKTDHVFGLGSKVIL